MEFYKPHSTQEKIEFLQKGLMFCFPINQGFYNRLLQNIEKKEKRRYRV